MRERVPYGTQQDLNNDSEPSVSARTHAQLSNMPYKDTPEYTTLEEITRKLCYKYINCYKLGIELSG